MEFADVDYALTEPEDLLATTDLTALNKRLGTMARRINGRCKGLLERNGDKMEFLHRTVYDFLRIEEMSRFLKDHTRHGHDPNLSIFKAFIAWIKRSTFACAKSEDPLRQIGGFVERMKQALEYARLAESRDEKSAALALTLLDNVERSIPRMLSRGQIEMTDPSFARDFFRQLVLGAGVGGYIRKKLAADAQFLNSRYADQYPSCLEPFNDPYVPLTATDRSAICNVMLKSRRRVQNGSSPDEQSAPTSARLHSHLCERVSRRHATALSDDSFIQLCWADELLPYVENDISRSILLGTNPSSRIVIPAYATVSGTRQGVSGHEIPIWLAFFLGLFRVYKVARPEAYEEVIIAMSNQFNPLQATIRSMRKSGCHSFKSECHSFWDVCQLYYPLPEGVMIGEVWETRILSHVLSKLKKNPIALTNAMQWVRPALSAEAYDALDSAVSPTSGKISQRRRHTEDEPAVSGKKRKKATGDDAMSYLEWRSIPYESNSRNSLLKFLV